ncbi:MAG TPA: hypothetical protein DCZ95_08465 [Verrucomicrobia bacterium]|nr:MAG: hypothetical protein A2X46_12500 [Lentisphaerae bacterium GWF2_57_35]HBA84111.1 hypothetical protein [Verrucomicrobiota bacterium]
MPKIETDTNQVYRKKYFVAADSIITAKAAPKNQPMQARNSVIDASNVVLSDRPIALRSDGAGSAQDIHVEVIKNGNEVKGLRISCPCGRHTELDVAYS